MRDDRIGKLARVLTEYSMEVRPGDLVVLSGGMLSLPLLKAAYRETLRLGGNPALEVLVPEMTEILLSEGSDDQLKAIDPFEGIASQRADAHLRVSASENTRSMTGISPARQQIYARARSEIRSMRMDRAASGALRWSSTVYPTQAHAQEAEMSLRDYEEFIAAAGWLDEADPVSKWREVGEYQARLIDWLTPKKEVRVISEDTDLTVKIGGRTWINSDGHRNFPSGEIFAGPIEDSVEGHIRFSFASIVQGREVDDIHLWFEKGKVVRAEAAKNQDFLESMLDTDDGARYLGEFAFGTNDNISRFTRNTLFDEKMGGTVHMALGAGYPDSGSKNRSAIHWDLIRDLRGGGEVWVDGELFEKDGKILAS
ncbi:MAG: aminopeptidase [Nitrolancea sp.]